MDQQKLALRLQQGLGFPEFQSYNNGNGTDNQQPDQSLPPSTTGPQSLQNSWHGGDNTAATSTTSLFDSPPPMGLPQQHQQQQQQQPQHQHQPGGPPGGPPQPSGPQSNVNTAGSGFNGTTQPLWSLYPASTGPTTNSINDQYPTQVHQIPENRNDPTQPPDFASQSFASESQQQRHNLIQHQHQQPHQPQQQHQHQHQLQQQQQQRQQQQQQQQRVYYADFYSIHNQNHLQNQNHRSPRGYYTTATSHHQSHAHTPEVEDHWAQVRAKYKAKSSIPLDLSHSNYGQQCISAAQSSRLPPFSLHTQEYDLLRSYLPYMHVTTYLNIRNGILRLWLSNPMVNVTMAEAAGCVREERFYGLAEVAFHFLVRHGYINYGCVDNYIPEVHSTIPDEEKKPRLTVVVIGAGIAGLGAARQLDALLKRYSHYFAEYEDIPRIIVLEGRRRIGGRIYSAPLKTDHECMVDMGAQMIMGFGKGNPLAVLVRRQLGLPVVPIEPYSGVYDAKTGKQFDSQREERVDKLFDHVLKRMTEFKNEMPSPNTANGDEVLMRAAKDPTTTRDDEFEMQTIAKLEENGDLPKPYDNPGKFVDQKIDGETKEEAKFLSSTGMKLKGSCKQIHIVPEPQGEMYPSLGETIDGMMQQLSQMAELTEEDVRLFNWHYANLEYSCCSNLDSLSLGSWNQDEGNEFAGRHSMIQTGYQSLARGLYIYPEKLDVRFKTSVKVVEYDQEQADVFLENGEKISADRVLCTLPLGVLKDRTVQFIPDLPQWKTDSIERLGFGVMNKVCLVFSQAFWDPNKDIVCIARDNKGNPFDQESYKSTRGLFYMFWNCSKQVGKPCLMGLVTGDAAVELANESDETIVDGACQALQSVFHCKFKIQESIVTRWQIDPFSRGSYSYIGLEATGADYDLMARPIGRSLFFAGEATCRARPGTVHGAYISGLRGAKEILTSLIGDVHVPHPLIPSKDHSRMHSSSAPPGSSKYPAVRSSMTSPAPPDGMNNLVRPPIVRQISNPHNVTSNTTESEPPQTVVSSSSSSSLKRRNSNADLSEAEQRLKQLREQRITDDNERMRSEMNKELGDRPVKPDRSGANPFLIFQKDFWEICRRDTDESKRQQTGDPNAKAARNEVRAALGKMWRELPEAKKKPYLEATKEIKATNNRKLEEYQKRVRVYDADADDFRRRWKEENASPPSEEEQQLQQLVQQEHQKQRMNNKHYHHHNKKQHY